MEAVAAPVQSAVPVQLTGSSMRPPTPPIKSPARIHGPNLSISSIGTAMEHAFLLPEPILLSNNVERSNSSGNNSAISQSSSISAAADALLRASIRPPPPPPPSRLLTSDRDNTTNTTTHSEVPAEGHLKRHSMLHRPYEGVKLAWELESARVVSYGRREDGFFWYTLHITPCPRYMRSQPDAPQRVLRPQPYVIYRIYEDFVELSTRLAYTFNLDASSECPLAPILESFTRAQQRNADVPFDMIEQLDTYVDRLMHSDPQIRMSRPMREFFGIWRSDVEFKLSQQMPDPLARAYHVSSRLTITRSHSRQGSLPWFGLDPDEMSDYDFATMELLEPQDGMSRASVSTYNTTAPTKLSHASKQQEQPANLAQRISGHGLLKRNNSVTRLVRRAKTMLLRKRPSQEETLRAEKEVAEVAAAATLRNMCNGSAGVVAITAPLALSPVSKSQSSNTSATATTMPRLVRIGSLRSLNQRPRPLGSQEPFSPLTLTYSTAGPTGDVAESGEGPSPLHMPRSRVTPVKMVVQRSQSLRDVSPRKRTPVGTTTSVQSRLFRPQPPAAAAAKETPAETPSKRASDSTDSTSAKSVQIRPPSGSALAAVAVRSSPDRPISSGTRAALRRPLVRAITLAGLRRKRTLDQLKQEGRKSEEAPASVDGEGENGDAVEKDDTEQQPLQQSQRDSASLRDLRLSLHLQLSSDFSLESAWDPEHSADKQDTAPNVESETAQNESPLSLLQTLKVRSADSSPTESHPQRALPEVTDAVPSLASLAAAVAATQRSQQPEENGDVPHVLRHYRSQPGIRDSVLIRRTELISPRPTPAQIVRARSITHKRSNPQLARKGSRLVRSPLGAESDPATRSIQSKTDETGMVDIKVVLDKTRLIKVQVPRHTTYAELCKQVEAKFERCGHGDAALRDRTLVYREENENGAIVRIEGDFALGVVLFDCPGRVTFFAV